MAMPYQGSSYVFQRLSVFLGVFCNALPTADAVVEDTTSLLRKA
jgi:hypothetical protein